MKIYVIYKLLSLLFIILVDILMVSKIFHFKRGRLLGISLFAIINTLQYVGSWIIMKNPFFEDYYAFKLFVMIFSSSLLIPWIYYMVEGPFLYKTGKYLSYCILLTVLYFLVNYIYKAVVPDYELHCNLLRLQDYTVLILQFIGSIIVLLVVYLFYSYQWIEQIPCWIMKAMGFILMLYSYVSIFSYFNSSVGLTRKIPDNIYLIIVVIPVFIFVILEMLYVLAIKRCEGLMILHNIKISYEQYRMIEEQQEYIHEFKHDLMNHILIIERMKEYDHNTQAIEYRNAILSRIESIKGCNVYEKPFLNVMTNYFTKEWGKKGKQLVLDFKEQELPLVDKTYIYSVCSLYLYFIEKSLNVIPSATDKIQIIIKKEKENIVIISNYGTNFTPSFLARLKLLQSFYMLRFVLNVMNVECRYDMKEGNIKTVFKLKYNR